MLCDCEQVTELLCGLIAFTRSLGLMIPLHRVIIKLRLNDTLPSALEATLAPRMSSGHFYYTSSIGVQFDLWK